MIIKDDNKFIEPSSDFTNDNKNADKNIPNIPLVFKPILIGEKIISLI